MNQLDTNANKILAAHATYNTNIVSLAALREDAGISHPDFDDAIRHLHRTNPRVAVIPESNQKALTHAHRAAAITIGNQDRHHLSIIG